MTNFTVGVPDQRGYGFTNYNLSREGNHITVAPPNNGMRGGAWESYDIELKGDRVDIQGPDRQYRIKLSPDGVQVDDPRNDGMRSGGLDMSMQVALKPEQYESVGLSVASSLIHIPLPAALLGS